MTTTGVAASPLASGVGKGVPRLRAGLGSNGRASLFSSPGNTVQPQAGSLCPRQTSSLKASTVVCCWSWFGGFLGLYPYLVRLTFPAGVPIAGEPAWLLGTSEMVDDDVASLVLESHGMSFQVDLPVAIRSQSGSGWVRHGGAC